MEQQLATLKRKLGSAESSAETAKADFEKRIAQMQEEFHDEKATLERTHRRALNAAKSQMSTSEFEAQAQELSVLRMEAQRFQSVNQELESQIHDLGLELNSIKAEYSRSVRKARKAEQALDDLKMEFETKTRHLTSTFEEDLAAIKEEHAGVIANKDKQLRRQSNFGGAFGTLRGVFATPSARVPENVEMEEEEMARDAPESQDGFLKGAGVSKFVYSSSEDSLDKENAAIIQRNHINSRSPLTEKAF